MTYPVGTSKELILNFASKRDSFSTKMAMEMLNLPYVTARTTLYNMEYDGVLERVGRGQGQYTMWAIKPEHKNQVVVGQKVGVYEFRNKAYDGGTYTVMNKGTPSYIVIPYDEYVKNNPVTRK